ncbi:hypothetical protein B0H11DRAFT_2419863 [Mycena galericulata]|nr:hypothetical protein B0H11DRAFT_2419863 [Mycena galericulata]
MCGPNLVLPAWLCSRAYTDTTVSPELEEKRGKNQTLQLQLPPELLHAIIDKFGISLKDVSNPRIYSDRRTLRVCALTSREFARLYEVSRPFSKLLSTRPHIGFYVRNLILSYSAARSKSVESILSSLPNLKTLTLHPLRTALETPPFPTYGRNSFLAAFSLDSLRRLELRYHQFTDAPELDSILSSSLNLEELLLTGIQFTKASESSPDSRPAPRVVLRLLELYEMQDNALEAIFSTFTAVDIKHLRSLSVDRYSSAVFRANAYSIGTHTFVLRNTILDFPEPFARILPTLRTLNFRAYHISLIPGTLRRLGNLATVETLTRISTLAPGIASAAWSEFDSLLADALGPESGVQEMEVCLDSTRLAWPSAGNVSLDLTEARRWLPALDAKGVLRMSDASSSSELKPWL